MRRHWPAFGSVSFASTSIVTAASVGELLLSGAATGGWLPATHWLVCASAIFRLKFVSVSWSKRKPKLLAAASVPYLMLRRRGLPALPGRPRAAEVQELAPQVALTSAQPGVLFWPQPPPGPLAL